MCDPVSGAMAGLAVLQQQQQQEAAKKEADAINRQFSENNQMQIDAYNSDMQAYWDEELKIQEAMHDNAEDAADATLAMKIQQKSDASAMLIANAEATPGGGGSPMALLGNLRRSQMNAARDLDEEFQAGVVALGGEKAALQRDKIARRNQAIGAINSAPRAGYQSKGSKLLALGMAGGSAYVQGQAMQGNPLFGKSSAPPLEELSTAGLANNVAMTAQHKALYGPTPSAIPRAKHSRKYQSLKEYGRARRTRRDIAYTNDRLRMYGGNR